MPRPLGSWLAHRHGSGEETICLVSDTPVGASAAPSPARWDGETTEMGTDLNSICSVSSDPPLAPEAVRKSPPDRGFDSEVGPPSKS